MIKLYFVAGEPSGDLHAANLWSALTKLMPGVKGRGLGGDKLQAAGLELFRHNRPYNVMGFVEVLRHLPAFRKLMLDIRQDILSWQPDMVILIDYPGFNMRLARFLKAQNIRTCYYILPQLWAWYPGRAKSLRQTIDIFLAILPFEPDFYRRYQIQASYVGHPLVEMIQTYQPQKISVVSGGKPPVVALLPGSRKHEVQLMLPEMLKVAKIFPDLQFVIAGTSALPENIYNSNLSKVQAENCHLVMDSTYDVLAIAQYALVTSGTATLETALFEVPMLVLYKGNPVSFFLARKLITVPYISLINLLLNRPAVPELIQNSMHAANISQHLRQLMLPAATSNQQSAFQDLKAILGEKPASLTAAKIIQSSL